jgi:carbon-monoxide dehydrogenase small subunit
VDLDGAAIKSCTVLAVMVEGSNITTIEGLAGIGQLHPIQSAFQKFHALQCGYCTPGMIMSIRQMVDRGIPDTEDGIRHELDGNICRCTGYENIVRAIESLRGPDKESAR